MEKSLQIHKLVPVLIEPDKIGLDIEAALTESDEGVDFAVLNVTFEVRVGVRKVYEKKSDAQTGQFIANNVEVGEVEPQFDVMVSATDEVGKLNVKVKVDASTVVKEIKDRQKINSKHMDSKTKKRDVDTTKDQSDTEPELSPAQIAELAEKERQIKRVITEALARLLNKRYCTNTTGEIWDYSSKEYIHIKIRFELENGWIQSEKNLKYVPNSWDHIPNSGDIARSDILVLKANQNHSLVKRKIIETARELPITFIDNLDCFYETSWAEEVISELAKINPQAILEKLIEFYKYDWAKNVISKIANSNPALVFNLIELFEYHPWAGEVAMIAAARDLESAIKNYDKYRDQPWAEEVLAFSNIKKEEKLAELEKSAKKAEEAKKAQEAKKAEEAKKAQEAKKAEEAKKAQEAKKAEEAKKAQEAKKAEEAKSVEIEVAIKSFSEKFGATKDTFLTFVKYQNDERVLAAVVNLAELYPESFLSNHEIYFRTCWAERIVKVLTKICPLAKQCLMLERYYGEKPTEENIMTAIDSASSLNETYVNFERSKIGKSREEADRMDLSHEGFVALTDSINYDKIIDAIFECFEKFKHLPWAKDAIQRIAKNDPAIVISSFDKFKNEVWARDVLEICADLILSVESFELTEIAKDVEMYYEDHKDQPWAQKLLNNVNKALNDEEKKSWLDRAKMDPKATVSAVLKMHIDEPWAEAVLFEICDSDFNLSVIVCSSLDSYATKPWGKLFYLYLIEKFPAIIFKYYPANSYGWDNEIIDTSSKYWMEEFKKDGSNKNTLIFFCLSNPESLLTKKIIARLSITNPDFAKHLKRRRFLGIF